jgi:hypothetical protein
LVSALPEHLYTFARVWLRQAEKTKGDCDRRFIMHQTDISKAKEFFREASECLGREKDTETPLSSEGLSIYNLAFGLEHLASAIRTLQQEVKAVKDELSQLRAQL